MKMSMYLYKPVPAPCHRNGSVVQPEPVVHEPELRVPDPAVLQPDTGIEESYQSEDDSNHPNESMIMDHQMKDTRVKYIRLTLLTYDLEIKLSHHHGSIQKFIKFQKCYN